MRGAAERVCGLAYLTLPPLGDGPSLSAQTAERGSCGLNVLGEHEAALAWLRSLQRRLPPALSKDGLALFREDLSRRPRAKTH